MPLTMFDTITPATVPANPQAVAGYVGGRWADASALFALFPNAHHLSIAINAFEKARCLDVEPGDAFNAQAPGWFKNFADKSQGKPVLYTSASNVNALVQTMTAAGIQRGEYLVWSAHYTYQEHLCGTRGCPYPQADATQWTDKALGRNLDQSIVSDAVFGAPKPPAPAPPKRSGHARALLTLDLSSGQWKVMGLPGIVRFAQPSQQASVEAQIDVSNGKWRVHSLPFNSPPLGK